MGRRRSAGVPTTSPAAEEAQMSSSSSAEEAFELEDVLDCKFGGKGPNSTKVLFLIKWKGYGDDDNTWEPENNVDSVGPKLRSKMDSFKQNLLNPKSTGSVGTAVGDPAVAAAESSAADGRPSSATGGRGRRRDSRKADDPPSAEGGKRSAAATSPPTSAAIAKSKKRPSAVSGAAEDSSGVPSGTKVEGGRGRPRKLSLDADAALNDNQSAKRRKISKTPSSRRAASEADGGSAATPHSAAPTSKSTDNAVAPSDTFTTAKSTRVSTGGAGGVPAAAAVGHKAASKKDDVVAAATAVNGDGEAFNVVSIIRGVEEPVVLVRSVATGVKFPFQVEEARQLLPQSLLTFLLARLQFPSKSASNSQSTTASVVDKRDQ